MGECRGAQGDGGVQVKSVLSRQARVVGAEFGAWCAAAPLRRHASLVRLPPPHAARAVVRPAMHGCIPAHRCPRTRQARAAGGGQLGVVVGPAPHCVFLASQLRVDAASGGKG